MGDVGRVHVRDHLVGQQHVYQVSPRHGGGDVGHIHAVAGSGLPVLVVAVAHHHSQTAVAQVEGHRTAKVTIPEDCHRRPVEGGQVGAVAGKKEALCRHVVLRVIRAARKGTPTQKSLEDFKCSRWAGNKPGPLFGREPEAQRTIRR